MVSQVSYLTWFPNIRCLIFCATRGGFSKRGKAGAKVKLQLAEPCGHAPGSRDPITSRIGLPTTNFSGASCETSGVL